MKKIATIGMSLAMLAGVLVSGSPAQAGPVHGSGEATAGAAATAMRKPLRAERRTDIGDLACGTSTEYASGSNATITVTHYNCTDTSLTLALTGVASDGAITLTSACQEFLPGEAWFWEVAPGIAARRPTFIYRVTECA